MFKQGVDIFVESDDECLFASLKSDGFKACEGGRHLFAIHNDHSVKTIRAALFPSNVRNLFS